MAGEVSKRTTVNNFYTHYEKYHALSSKIEYSVEVVNENSDWLPYSCADSDEDDDTDIELWAFTDPLDEDKYVVVVEHGYYSAFKDFSFGGLACFDDGQSFSDGNSGFFVGAAF